MTQVINCDYCGQRNCLDALCCEFCGAPAIMTELKVRTSWDSFGNSKFMMACTTSAMDYPEASGLCTTASPIEFDELLTPFEDHAPAVPDPPKRGWREWLGIGGR